MTKQEQVINAKLDIICELIINTHKLLIAQTYPEKHEASVLDRISDNIKRAQDAITNYKELTKYE